MPKCRGLAVQTHDRRRGVVLVSVLWTMALLSALAMAAGVTFRGFAGVLSVEHARLQVAALQTAGLEIAAGLVESLSDRPINEISTDIKLSTGSVRLLISDDGGRIDVGRAPEEVLAGLFRVIGAPQAQAMDVAHAIVAWRDRDTGPGSRQGLPSDAAKHKSAGVQPFTDVRQLALVPGFPPAWLDSIAPLTTVVGSDTVNPLTAPADVIAALPGMEPGRLAAFLEARRAFPTDANHLVAMLCPAQRYAKPAKRQAITVLITAALADGYAATARAVIVLLPRDVEPYRVLTWSPLPVGMAR